MAKIPHLTPNRCGVYCFRIILSARIRRLPNAPKEIRISLGSKDRHQAFARYVELYPHTRALLHSLDELMLDGTNDMAELSQALKLKIDHWKVTHRLNTQLTEAKHQAAKMTLALTKANNLAASQQEQALSLSEENRRLQTTVDTLKSIVSAPQVEAKAQSPSSRETLEKLVKRFLEHEAKHSTNTQQTQSNRRNHLMRMLDIIGHDLPLYQLSAEHLRRYRDLMHRIPKNFDKQGFDIPESKAERPAWFTKTIDAWQGATLAGGGIDNAFKQVRKLMAWAYKEHHLERDFTTLLEVSDKHSKESQTEATLFSEEQLKRLFNQGYLYGDQRRKGERTAAWKFWVPLFGLTTGMRSSEIGKLKFSDLYQEGDIWCINIEDAKTPAGNRIIPVPQSLLDAGLLSYRQELLDSAADETPDRLFPDLKPKGGHTSNAIGAFFNCNRHSKTKDKVRYFGYMADTQVSAEKDKQRLSFHSLRHGFITRLLPTPLASTGQPLSLTDIKSIVGHGIDFADTYGVATQSWSDITHHVYNHRDEVALPGSEERLSKLKEALDSIDLGVELTAIHYGRFKARRK